jgi:hypothetical protein
MILLCSLRVDNPKVVVLHVISGGYVVLLSVAIGKWMLLSGLA